MREIVTIVATDQSKAFGHKILSGLFWILSLIYAAIIAGRNLLYDKKLITIKKLKHPVISVGNITWGGVGKTPVVEFIVRHLKAQNVRAAVLTRGYMPKDQKSTSNRSDEAHMLESSLHDIPVIIGADRFRKASKYLKDNTADIFVIDDGLQHRQLVRDLNIIVVNTNNPFGNGHCIPRGILREPLSALGRADLIVLTKSGDGDKRDEIKKRISQYSDALVIETIHKPKCLIDLVSGETVDVNLLDDQKIGYVCGIGDPQSFEETLTKRGAKIGESFIFEDHHFYTQDEIQKICDQCHQNLINVMVTTQKDAVKIKTLFDAANFTGRFLYLKIEVSITKNKGEFLERINHLLER